MTQDITFKVKRSKVNLQGAGRGHIVAASRTTLRNSLVSSCCSPVALIHCEVWGSEPECRKNECSYSFSGPDSLQFYSRPQPVLPALTDSFETAVIIPTHTCSTTRKLGEDDTDISVCTARSIFWTPILQSVINLATQLVFNTCVKVRPRHSAVRTCANVTG